MNASAFDVVRTRVPVPEQTPVGGSPLLELLVVVVLVLVLVLVGPLLLPLLLLALVPPAPPVPPGGAVPDEHADESAKAQPAV